MEHELYNIEPKEFKVLDRVEIDNNLRYELEPIQRPTQCPQCKDSNIVIRAKTQRKARDLNEFGKMVGIVINGQWNNTSFIYQKAVEKLLKEQNENRSN